MLDGAAPGTRIAVVIPTLDEERSIGACLESARDADEIVVSDGGSADRTIEAARRSDPRVVVVEGPRGRGGQLNRGVAAAAAPIVLFLHADCLLPRGWAGAVRAALADPAVAVGCFRLRTEPPLGREASSAERRWWRLLDLRSRGWGLPYGDQALFARRESVLGIGGFPEIPLMEDIAFVRAALRNGRLARLPLEVRTTARRFARHPIRARVCTATFPALFRLGVSAETLARWYGKGR
ncbi:MAG: glycosyltransferase [Acidobacteriota bacterium]